jgi:thiol-disulfide isomerase/thioredoxin
MKKILFTIVCLLFAGAAFAQAPAGTCTCECCKNTEKNCVCCNEGQDCVCECCKGETACACACCKGEATCSCECCKNCACCKKAEPKGVLRATPAYDEPGHVVEAIVAQYPGKIVFVDFWATWCFWCLKAMDTMEPIKPWLDENVVRVYVSMHNSDPAKYDEMIAKIGGEHYLLTKEEENAMFAHLGRTGLPTFFLYKDGKQAFKSVGYKMGNEGLMAEIEKLK